jgi:hypothetical protein
MSEQSKPEQSEGSLTSNQTANRKFRADPARAERQREWSREWKRQNRERNRKRDRDYHLAKRKDERS